MTGLLALENLPSEAVAEAAIAAALVLEHVPQAVAILLRPGALNALVDAALDEAANPAPDNSLGKALSCVPHSGLLFSLTVGKRRCVQWRAGPLTRSALRNMKVSLSTVSV